MIKTIGNTVGGGGAAAEKMLAIAWPRHPRAPRHSLVGLPKSVPTSIAPSPTVFARVNHGRWIADCPFCAGAELVDPIDPRFFCMSCDNDSKGGRWLRVTFPVNLQEIEAILESRPSDTFKNWDPRVGETAAGLRRENELALNPNLPILGG